MSDAPRLTIALATVVNRAALFALLHAEVKRQAEGKPVEILVACDDKEISIGKKRQNLLEQATGNHICFIDDDDWISTDYVDSILTALETNPDCVGFKITCTTNGYYPASAIASMRYQQWCDGRDGYAHCRSPYHKTPARTTIARQVGFPDLRYGEDRIYSEGITRLIKTESFVDKVLYFYRFNTENFATKYGLDKDGSKIPNNTRSGKANYDNQGKVIPW
jgi:hypothetical protein